MIPEIATSEFPFNFGVIEATVYVEALGAFFRTTIARNAIPIIRIVGMVDPKEPTLVKNLPNDIPFILKNDNIQITTSDKIRTNILLLARSGLPNI